jgi:hypothetical protein
MGDSLLTVHSQNVRFQNVQFQTSGFKTSSFKRPVSKRPKRPVFKASGLQTYGFQNVKTPLTASCRVTSSEHNKLYAALWAVLSVKRNMYFGEKD